MWLSLFVGDIGGNCKRTERFVRCVQVGKQVEPEAFCWEGVCGQTYQAEAHSCHRCRTGQGCLPLMAHVMNLMLCLSFSLLWVSTSYDRRSCSCSPRCVAWVDAIGAVLSL
jgi:hypothetical protein